LERSLIKAGSLLVYRWISKPDQGSGETTPERFGWFHLGLGFEYRIHFKYSRIHIDSASDSTNN
jgi:hypothetical protein